MTLQDLGLAGLERSINAVLALDPVALERLAALHGRCIALALEGLDLTLYFVPAQDGRLQVMRQVEGEPDCTLAGSPVDLVRASDKRAGPAQLFAGRVRIDGDARTAQRFSEALADLDIDWEEQLSQLLGDVAAHQVGRGLRAMLAQARRMRDSSSQNLAEYLTEEARLLPHRYEIDEFLAEVDTLRDDVERLEARINLLEKAKPGDDR
jgi:ubiquinone biosynthesis protein UbiJ